jgi:hypothetical protein
MSLAQRLHRWGSPRRLTALLLLVVALWMLFPLSLQFSPAKSEKDVSAPFPCQNRPCGCKTADQCWKKCCCFTNAQKIAWANSRGVKVPNDVLLAAQTESGLKPLAKACCQREQVSSDASKPEKRSLRSRWVISLEELKCSGIDTSVVGFPACLPPVAAVRVDLAHRDRGAVVRYEDRELLPVWREPPTPPPKIVIT